MKIKIDDSIPNIEEIKSMLVSAGFVVSDDASLIVTSSEAPIYIRVINKWNDIISLPVKEIVSIESLGKDNYVYTMNDEYIVRDTLENLVNKLGNNYLRISKSTIIEKNSIKRIGPSIQMKYKIILINGRVSYVTRNYYYSFKEYFGL